MVHRFGLFYYRVFPEMVRPAAVELRCQPLDFKEKNPGEAVCQGNTKNCAKRCICATNKGQQHTLKA